MVEKVSSLPKYYVCIRCVHVTAKARLIFAYIYGNTVIFY